MKPTLRQGLSASIAYMALIAASVAVLGAIFDPASDVFQNLAMLVPVQCAAVALTIWVVSRSFGWGFAGFGTLQWRALIWLAPATALLAVMFWDLVQAVEPGEVLDLGLPALSLLAILTFLIAFGEEVMFRGVLLRSAMTAMPIALAMLLSALLFGVFHFINALGGQSLGNTGQQVIFAGLVGLSLAPIAIKLGSLWPLILWHWFWNLAVFLSQILGVLHPLALSGMAFQAIVSVLLWVDLARNQQKRR